MRSRTTRIIGLGLAAAAFAAQPARAQLVAERIEAANAGRTILRGPDAVGGLGDWALQNGTACAVIADPAHESDLATTGGGLLDLGLCGRADDQFMLYLELLNGSLADPVRVTSISPEIEADVARLIARGGGEGLSVETQYTLDAAQPTRLGIETVVQRSGDGPRLGSFSLAIANVRSLSPFSVSTDGRGESRGYVHPSYRGLGVSGIAKAGTAADLVVAVGAEELDPGISYGQRLVSARLENASGEATPVPAFFFSDGLSTALTVFPRPFWIGGDSQLSVFRLLQSALMDLPEGSRLVVEQELWVGARADAAAVTDQLWPEAPLLQGSVDDARAVVHVERPEDGPITQVRVGAEGRFAVRLAPGRYRLRVEARGGRSVEREVQQEAGGTDVGRIATGATARVVLPRGAAMRLAFLGIDGTPDPDFHADGRGWVMEGEAGALDRAVRPERDLHLAGTANDPGAVVVAPGRYRVFATRGPEFSLEQIDLSLGANETAELSLEPVRVIETPGWVSSDFHIHSAPSLDNPTHPERRLRSYVADGAEVLVSSEHEKIYDFAPLIREVGLAGRLPSLVGLEVTSEVQSELAPYSIGHANVFPLPPVPLAYRRGAVANEGRRWRDVIADLRAIPGERVIQLNHARFADRELERRAFLSHMGPAEAPYDPELPLETGANRVLIEPDPSTGIRDLDFDAMELLNGPYMESYWVLREDWFSFLRQGEKIVGTANSDSHFLSDPVATPRNYLSVANDTPAGFQAEAFVAAVRAGRMYGTTGPIVSLSLGDAGLGDTYAGKTGTLSGTVRTAPWISVRELQVFVSGEVAETLAIEPGVPFETALTFEADAFVTTEVHGDVTPEFEAVLPRFAPFAFTNPIWVDADGDGEWTAPGH
jgi:hypothetical protein